jgi:hypothetical protein
MAKLVDAIFFNLAMRLYCLRIVIVASVGVATMTGVEIIGSSYDFASIWFILFPVLVAVHHLIR